jgi:prephenate dehydrogenase
VKRAGLPVIGFDPDPHARDYALGHDLIDESREGIEALWELAGTLVVAAPLDATVATFERLGARKGGPQLVIDVSSVKLPLLPFVSKLPRFVPTHPLAGAERSGPEAAREDLFVQRPWVYVPVREEVDEQARIFIASMGARPVALDAARHDRIVALTSHLPQLLSSLLADLLSSQEDPAIAELYGPGLRSMLRLAHSPWAMWSPVLEANASHIIPALSAMAERIRSSEAQLDRGEREALALLFDRANDFVARIEREEET